MLVRWSITYILTILFLAAVTAAVWFAFSAWEASKTIAELEQRITEEQKSQSKLRAEMRNIKSRLLEADSLQSTSADGSTRPAARTNSGSEFPGQVFPDTFFAGNESTPGEDKTGAQGNALSDEADQPASQPQTSATATPSPPSVLMGISESARDVQ